VSSLSIYIPGLKRERERERERERVVFFATAPG
jgi:hypothetical protein